MEVVDYLAEQLGIEDPSALRAYGERGNTRPDHPRELRQMLNYHQSASAEAESRVWPHERRCCFRR